MNRDEALRRLGVKPQTLYAYVSRGLVASRPSARDSRASEFSADDVAALLRRRRTGRRRKAIAAGAMSWGDPVMETKLTTVRDGQLVYRGRNAVDLSRTMSLEDVAALLWSSEVSAARRTGAASPSAPTAKERGFLFLAARAAVDPPCFGRSRASLAEEASGLLFGLCSAMANSRGPGLYHERLGRFWSLSKLQADTVRRALVLVADHELNPSTFAARIAASTGAPLAACALAGYSTLCGPLHGEASTRALSFLRSAQASGPQAALAALAAQGLRIPATGHPLYPDGDPRARALLARIKPSQAIGRAISAAVAASDAEANIDMALAALTLELDLPDDAPFILFASGRMAGWMAHAIEQVEAGRPIRPRANYVGE